MSHHITFHFIQSETKMAGNDTVQSTISISRAALGCEVTFTSYLRRFMFVCSVFYRIL